MPMNPATLAAMRAASKLKPQVENSLEAQRVLEAMGGGIPVSTPRCRVERSRALMPDGFEVPLLVFTPLAAGTTSKLAAHLASSPIQAHAPELRGTILFFHGGGWVSGNVNLYADACRLMATVLERRVVSVGYRLAPEHRFPRAAEDCYEVARQLFSGELLAGVDPGNIVLAGDSAGGNLAAVTSLMARDRKAFSPAAQLLLYPVTYSDHDPATTPFDSVRQNGRDYLLTAEDMQEYVELYASRPLDRTDPYLAPLLMRDLTDQPRTLVVTADLDPLRDEGEAYAVALADTGCDVRCHRMLNAIHGYLLYPSFGEVTRDTLHLARAFLDGVPVTAPSRPRWLVRHLDGRAAHRLGGLPTHQLNGRPAHHQNGRPA